eukprot:TRINITY_DN30218_c0_g1_i1.p1 TRINITY_DN30218_c0_g1~~TRINITY_DN30218_c0_g1_i1.p1  ORF type:complete len:274 (-),score=65.67 TRINITY_DN30218_c0_g1_i1:547-1368(-)
MAKKRKSESAGLEEVDRTMYSSFCAAANSISQLYTQAQNQQRVAFEMGERHALEKLQQWVLRQYNGAAFVSVEHLILFLQTECSRTDESAPSLAHGGAACAAVGSHEPIGPGHGGNQASGDLKASVFVRALSSPQRRSLPSLSEGFVQTTRGLAGTGSGDVHQSHQSHFGGQYEEERHQQQQSQQNERQHLQQQERRQHQQQPHPSQEAAFGSAPSSLRAAAPNIVSHNLNHINHLGASLQQQQLPPSYLSHGSSERGPDILDGDANMDTFFR